MPMNKKYHPDYRALYPSVDISPIVMAALKKSDRKMEYIEWELKHPRVRRNRKGEIIRVLPPREYSLEYLQERNQQFMGTARSPEELYLAAEHRRQLRHCLAKLDRRDRRLLDMIYHDNLTERECADKLGISQKTVHKRKRGILCKLLKMMETTI